MNIRATLAIAACIGAVLVIQGCSSAARWENTPPQQHATSGSLKKSKQGNPPFYEVFGVRYNVMDSANGYRERGIASWYGKKFHGRLTSNGERYDMYAMTAAHKTLPLPTNVRVTNLDNGRSVVLRVNDRGPFVKNRLIDLSYTAARELDIIAKGTGRVEVVALTATAGTGTTTASVKQQMRKAQADDRTMYVQVGAFGEEANAVKLAKRLAANGMPKVIVHETRGSSSSVYRVRIGPISGATEYDAIVRKVNNLQIMETHLVVEPG